LKLRELQLEINKRSEVFVFGFLSVLNFGAHDSQVRRMEAAIRSRQLVRFGIFELDLRAGELRKQGVRIKLQGQPFQVLEMLLEQPGEVVTREELQQRVWADGSFVDYEQGLNIAIKKLRLALGDSADNPRFIETLARRGYRFIAPVEGTIDTSTVEEFFTGPTVSEPRTTPAEQDTRAGAKKRKRRPLVWLAAFLALTAGLGVWLCLYHPGTKSPNLPLRILPVTSFPGFEMDPAFSPDGNMVAFSWNGEKEENFDIYVKLLHSGAPLRLTSNPADEISPAWSPDGQYLAFLRSNGQYLDIILIPALGGPERRLGQSQADTRWMPPVGLSWSPDGKFLAFVDKSPEGRESISLLSIETGERRRVTYPPKYLEDRTPVFSPDGQNLAFSRSSGDIYLLLLAQGLPLGEPRRLTFDEKEIWGLTFSSDGRSVVFSSNRAGNYSLWRIATAGGEPQRLAVGEQNTFSPSIAAHHDRLVYELASNDMNIWRADALSPGRSPFTSTRHPFTRLIASTGDDLDPRFAPDGKRIVFASNRSGCDEIWVCDSSGTNSMQVTNLCDSGSPNWSPDSRQIAFNSQKEGYQDIYVVSAEGGTPRRLTTHSSHDGGPSWSMDGRWIYFASNRTGDVQIWKLPSQGGTAVQVTRNGGREAFESPDGKWLYYIKEAKNGIWRIPVDGGEETQVIDEGQLGLWGVANSGILLVSLEVIPPRVKFFSFATHRLIEITTLKDWKGVVDTSGAVSPDGRWILYVQYDHAGSDLMLVENFH
jgi:Tol biopolymer transport system component/DNA-binding winged helix-turn-helix (wHTH) protein